MTPEARELLRREEAWVADMEANVTHILQRPLFHMLFDVVFHSILTFNFKGKPVRRGWLDVGLVGDTRTGKSEVMARLCQHYGTLGPVDCERTSMAGLVGGLSKVGSNGHNAINWGIFALQDRRACVLDETTGLRTEDISSMSGMRSSGMAEIVKIEKERAWARVRKIWLFNPRTERNRKIRTYTYGVLTIPEAIGRAEDVARFDLCTGASSEDVSLEVLNRTEVLEHPHEYTQERCKEHLYWCWRREAEQVLWAEGAEDLVLKLATSQCQRYHSSIPLVEPGDQRFKLARVAVAWAARFCSTDDSRQQVIVRPEHVEFADWFMDQCYCYPAFAYDKYSQAKGSLDRPLEKQDADRLQKELDEFPYPDAVRIVIKESGIAACRGVLPNDSYPKLIAWFVVRGLAAMTEKGPVLTKKGADLFTREDACATNA